MNFQKYGKFNNGVLAGNWFEDRILANENKVIQQLDCFQKGGRLIKTNDTMKSVRRKNILLRQIYQNRSVSIKHFF